MAIATILGLLVKPVTDYFTTRQEIKAKRAERLDRIDEARTTASIQRISEGDRAASDLDEYFVRTNGWKDDISFYLFLMPALLAFHPEAVPHVNAGFAALTEMPEWYQVTLGLMLIAVWGYRRMLRPLLEVVLKKKLGVS